MKTNFIFISILLLLIINNAFSQTTNLGAFSGTTNSNSSNIGAYAGQNNTGGGNVFLGYSAGWASGTSSANVFLGSNAGQKYNGSESILIGNNVGGSGVNGSEAIPGGGNNVFIGSASGFYSNGSNNSFVGSGTGRNTTGNNNCFYGSNSGNLNFSGSGNSFYGVSSGNSNLGSNNTFLGSGSGSNITTGNNNTFLGSITSAPVNINNSIIIGDGNNNQRFYIHSNGFAGIGLGNNIIPLNMLEVKSAFASTYNATNSSGLRLTNLKNTIVPIANPSTNKGVLSVNANGDVIFVTDQVGTGTSTGTSFTSTCPTLNFLPKSTGANSMVCSQIFDNGTSVGIASTGPFTYNNATNPPFSGGTVPNTGTVKLDVNGVIRTLGIFATSDKKFKKDIKPIKNALKTIEAIDGKTYSWNKDSNREMNFDDGNHSGFIAQELEKVLPHLVATGTDGSKAVNYMELLPYLVEGMKEQQKLIKDQQAQIDELKNQITNSFKTQNVDLLQFENTKIISISPNPSDDVIIVSLNIEKSVQSASLQVNDLNGKVLNNLSIIDRATNITKTLQKDNFGKGIYIVSLVVNGKSIDSKKIIFN